MDVADMDISCGRYDIFVANMVMADAVCGQYHCHSMENAGSELQGWTEDVRLKCRAEKCMTWNTNTNKRSQF